MKTVHGPAPRRGTYLQRRLAALGLFVAFLIVGGAGSRWLMTANDAAGAGAHLAAAEARRLPAVGSTAPTPPRAGPSTASVGVPVLAAKGPSHLAAGSDPTVLPGPIMIADKLNNRLLIIDPRGRTLWQFPRPGDLTAGQSFKIPDDAFFTPDGRQIIATEEDNQVIRVIDITTHKITYTYGTPGAPGSGFAAAGMRPASCSAVCISMGSMDASRCVPRRSTESKQHT